VAIRACGAASVVSAIGLFVLADALGPRLIGGAEAEAAAASLRWAALCLAVLAPTAVAIAATRGLGMIAPFVAIQNIGLPVGRLVAVAVVVALGGGAAAVVAAWTVPAVGALVLALALLVLGIRRTLASVDRPDHSPVAPPRPMSEFWRFAAPRGITSSLEVSLVALNTLIVAVMIGPAAAGVFGAVSRFVTTGPMADQAVRILVAPRFSALLATNDTREAGRLYAITTPWIVLVSWPIFLVLAAAAPVIMPIFGEGFGDGATALAILSLTLCVTQLAGNVHTILLMSGRSDLQLLNRGIGLAVLVTLNLLLIPIWGVEGAAVAWSASMLVDTCLTVAQVHRIVGVRLRAPMLSRVCAVAIMAFGIPSLVSVHRLGGGTVRVGSTVLLGAVAYLAFLFTWRDRLHLRRPRRSGEAIARREPGADEDEEAVGVG
jgi:O-antigen/teichoic acid export membrane protein